MNLGGWFVLEPFISPDLFQRYADAGAIDEWTISTLMAADTANGGLAQLETHYDTFIVRQITLKLQVVRNLTNAIPPSFILVDSHTFPLMFLDLDRTRFCRDRGRWVELDPVTHPLVGYRRVGRRAFLVQHMLEVHSPCLPVGEEVRS